ncbi:GNAT family N-acetyltransferase [Lysinibacillus sp. RC79]|uniref:GNAT family N-acetyltransferase n=1 Tax=Lysinibacillus sp. RC79 TaxID=3156296 RepID=UPI00351691C3
MMKHIFDQINYKKLLNEKNRADTLGFSEKKYINTVLETKYNEPVLICYPADLSDFAVTIFLISFIKGKYHRAYMYLIFKDKVMNISDIGVLKDEAKSRGYGDLLMVTALEIAKSKGASIVTGNMIFESSEQRNRQINYYSKYGFQIDENYKLKLVL